jgi:organic radical activating enzyme
MHYPAFRFRNSGMNDIRVTHFDIELTNECNSRCIICPRESLKRPKGLMDSYGFDSVLRSATAQNIGNFVFSGFGEPCIHPKLASYITKTKKETDVSVQLNTNGGLITRELCDELLDSGLDSINFNVNGHDAESVSKVNQGVDFYDLLMNIDYLILRKEQRGYGIATSVQASLIDDHSKRDYLDFWFKRGIEKVVVQACNNRAGHLGSIVERTAGASPLPFPEKYCRCCCSSHGIATYSPAHTISRA